MGLSRTSHPEIDRGFRVLTRLLRGAGAFSRLAKGIDLKNDVMVTRSQVRLAALNSWPSGSTPVIAIGQSSALQSLAGNPPDVLATNFAQDAALFDKFPHRDVFMTK